MKHDMFAGDFSRFVSCLVVEPFEGRCSVQAQASERTFYLYWRMRHGYIVLPLVN